MSQALPEDSNLPNAGGHHYLPQPAQNQALAPGVSHFIDGSGPIFSMYLERAEEEDKKMAENWKADADGILIFTGLFSAAVASLISVSIQDIQQNPQDTSNFYLANIYQTIADPNRSNISAPSSPPPFTPPTFAVWVNGLWFLSLVISITCALLATLLQQWARRYLKATQPRYSLHKRARIRSFFAEGVEKSFLPLAVEALPTLLHISLFLFFAGLVVFLWNVDLTIFKLVLSWVGICVTLYGCISLIPIFRRDSPYYTPLTLLTRLFAVATLKVFLVTLEVFVYLCACFTVLFNLCSYYWSGGWHSCRLYWRLALEHVILTFPLEDNRCLRLKEVLEVTLMTSEDAALEVSSSIDTRAFMWTLDSLDEDNELERFFSSLPDFRSSKVVDDPLPLLTVAEKEKISETLLRFLDFTISSDLLPEAVKHQRAIMCAKALDLAEFSPTSGYGLGDTVFSAHRRGQQATNFGSITNHSQPEQTIFIQATVTGMVARPPPHDDSWFRQVAPNALGVPETVLRDYATRGDSLSLAVLIHVTRQQFTYFQYSTWPTSRICDILMEGSKFNARHTLPELQHDFCTLWNRIVLKAQNDDDRSIALLILEPIRNIYVTLHKDSDSAPTQFSASTSTLNHILSYPSSYPVCKVPGHVHDDSASTSISRTVRQNTTAVLPSLAVPSSSIPVPLHVIESPTNAPSLNNFHPAQTTIEALRSPATSTDLATASVIQDIDPSGITMAHPTLETSTSTPLSSNPPPAAVALQSNTDNSMASDPPNLSSLASMNAVPNNMLRAGSHRSIIVSTAPSASPGMTFAPDPDAAASPTPYLGQEHDNLVRPSVNRATHTNTMAAPDPPLQSPSRPSVTDSDVAIAGRSLRELNAEHIGDHPPDPSRYQYDVV